jgi:hypothetical protein
MLRAHGTDGRNYRYKAAFAMSDHIDWILFESRGNRGSAEVLCSQLELDGVPARIETHDLSGGIESSFHVMVPSDLLHRAKWITRQSCRSDTELEFLATGKLPTGKSQE